MSVKAKPGDPMLPAHRVMKSRETQRFARGLGEPNRIGYARTGWRQICGNARAHYYERGQIYPICGINVVPEVDPERGVPVPACKKCVRKRGGKL
jgi:hypothetical protein